MHEALCNKTAFRNTVALLINIKNMFLLVRAEFDFFNTRIPCGGVIVFDDIDQYPDMDQLDGYIRANGFAMLEQGECKISYVNL